MNLDSTVSDFLVLLEFFRPLFTKNSFSNFIFITLGWLISPGRRAVTTALVVTGLSKIRHHAAFHRFFSYAKWKIDDFGHKIFELILLHFLTDNARPIPIIIDDTLAKKKGDHIYGIGPRSSFRPPATLTYM